MSGFVVKVTNNPLIWEFEDFRKGKRGSEKEIVHGPKISNLILWTSFLKFGHSEMATKIWNCLPLDLTSSYKIGF